MVNIHSLEAEFSIQKAAAEVKHLRDRVSDLAQYEDPNLVLQENIARANRLLDFLEEHIDSDDGSPRGGLARNLEVAAKILDSITTAAAQMSSISFGSKDFEFKEKTLTLKELEVRAKIEGGSGSKAIAQTTNNTLVMTSNNELIEFLRNNKAIPEMLEGEIVND